MRIEEIVAEKIRDPEFKKDFDEYTAYLRTQAAAERSEIECAKRAAEHEAVV